MWVLDHVSSHPIVCISLLVPKLAKVSRAGVVSAFPQGLCSCSLLVPEDILPMSSSLFISPGNKLLRRFSDYLF